MAGQEIQLQFVRAFLALSIAVDKTATDKGWNRGLQNEGESIALMHSELSEALEALRLGNPPDEHIPEYSGVEAEFADVIIRIMHLSAAKGYDVGRAVIAKIEYNETRPHKHGGKLF